MKLRAIAFLLTLTAAQPLAAQPQVAPFLTILPGTTTKAEVDLTLGDARRRVSLEEEIYEYPVPKIANDAERIVVTFWPDSRAVARVDVYFTSPMAAEALRERIGGTRVVSREHAGVREELYYPRLHGLILSGGGDSQVAAFSYVSQRYLASVYVQRFDAMLAAKSYDAALVEAEKAAVVDPEGAQGYLAQARYFQAIGNDDEALAHFTTAVNARSGQREKYRAALGLAAMFERYRKAPDRAEAELKHALALALRADAAEAQTAYGDFLVRQKKLDEARTAYQRALESNEAYVLAHRALGALRWDAKEYQRALDNYAAVVNGLRAAGAAQDPNRGTAFFRYAFCLAQLGRADEALEAYGQAVASGAPRPETFLQRGLLYQRKNDHLRAVAEFREGLKEKASDPSLNRALTDSLISAGLGPDALRQAEVSLKLGPQDPERLLDMARGYALLKKKKESLEFARRAIAAGWTDRKALTGDPVLALIQRDGDFKKIVAQLQ